MWRVLQKPVTTLVTKKLAKEFAEMTPAPHDRPLSERRLMVYQRMLAEGGFRPVAWAKCYCKETNDTYRVNGKHTSTMLSGLEKIPEFYAVIESYEADTLEDVARLYATFDSKTQSRTANDIYLSFAATIPELSDVSSRLINLSVIGIAFSNDPERSTPESPAERAERLLDNAEFVIWLDGLASGGESTRDFANLARGPVVGAMYSSWSKSKKDATAFWQAVRDETGDSPSLPDRRLAKWLSTMSVAYGNGTSARASRKASPREFYVRSLHAWNAWRKDQTTELRYYPEAKIPAVA